MTRSNLLLLAFFVVALVTTPAVYRLAQRYYQRKAVRRGNARIAALEAEQRERVYRSAAAAMNRRLEQHFPERTEIPRRSEA